MGLDDRDEEGEGEDPAKILATTASGSSKDLGGAEKRDVSAKVRAVQRNVWKLAEQWVY